MQREMMQDLRYGLRMLLKNRGFEYRTRRSLSGRLRDDDHVVWSRRNGRCRSRLSRVGIAFSGIAGQLSAGPASQQSRSDGGSQG
jgi:hypothetical protein